MATGLLELVLSIYGLCFWAVLGLMARTNIRGLFTRLLQTTGTARRTLTLICIELSALFRRRGDLGFGFGDNAQCFCVSIFAVAGFVPFFVAAGKLLLGAA